MNCPKCFKELTTALCSCEHDPKPIIDYGWSCPICGHVWGPKVDECIRCNAPRINITTPKDIITYEKDSKFKHPFKKDNGYKHPFLKD